MVLLAYRHGLRAAEVVGLVREQVDFKTAILHVRRAKNGTPATHPLSGREMRERRLSIQARYSATAESKRARFPGRRFRETRRAAAKRAAAPHLFCANGSIPQVVA
jgi:integrase